MDKRGLHIGRLSEQTGVSVDTIRFYEKQRLLEPATRTEGGFRLFSTSDVERIQFIRRAQKLGFSLPEVRELLAIQHDHGEACASVREMLRAKVVTVRNKMRELELLERQLTSSLRKCERRLRSSGIPHEVPCPVLNEMAHRGSHEN